MKRYLSVISALAITLALTEFVFARAARLIEKKPTTDPAVVISAETMASCQLATQELGNNVIRGNYLYAYDKIYSRYKKRQVALHGEKKFKQQFLDAAKTLNNMGVTITKFKAEKPVGFFRVWPQIKPEAKAKIDSGQQKELLAGDVFYNRLIIVPTTQEFVIQDNNGVARKYLREGFQIAIAKETAIEGQEDWTFIDGSTMLPQDLRAMFPSLPQKLVLPERKGSEIK